MNFKIAARSRVARAVLAYPFAALLVVMSVSAADASTGATGQAAGATVSTFGIKPSHRDLTAPIDTRPRFDYSATPGAAQPDYVAISNDAYAPVQLTLYASDGFNTANDGFDVLPARDKSVDIGRWITLGSSRLTIKARGTVVVPFTLRVPAKATPGDHVGGIVASLRTTERNKKGDQVAVDHRVGVRVYLRVQGALDPRLSLSNLTVHYHANHWNPFGSGKVTVAYTLHNVGNVRLGATQSVSISGWYGGTVQSAKIADVTELLQGNSHDERLVVNSVVPAFQDKATVFVTPLSLPGDVDGQLVPITRTVHFSAVPWPLIGLVAIIALAVVWFFRRRSIRRRPVPAAAAPTAGKTAKPKARSATFARLGRLAGVVSTTVVLTGLLPQAGYAAAPVVGTLTVQPAIGNDLTSINIVTSGPCPAGTNVIGRVFGAGFPAEGQIVVSNSPFTTYVSTQGHGLVLALGLTLRDFVNLQADPVPLHGKYRLVVSCRMNSKLGDLGDFVGSVAFTTSRSYVAAEPKIDPASLVPVSGDPVGNRPTPQASSAAVPGAVTGAVTSSPASPAARPALAVAKTTTKATGVRRFAEPLEIAGGAAAVVGVCLLIRQRKLAKAVR